MKNTIELLIEAGYQHGQQYKWKETFTEEKILSKGGVDVATSFRCENLNEIPEVGQEIHLGLSEAHLWPTDVIVTRLK